MLNSVLAAALAGAGPGLDTTAARLTDTRFDGIERVNLRTKYNAPLDGNSHPMTQAAALAAYPNCGATGTIERDTAAWLQAEYDLRTAASGLSIIALPPGARMVVSQQLYIQNASTVWFHGSRNVVLLTAGCGTTPAIRLSNGSNLGVPLSDFNMQAQATGIGAPTNGAGLAWTGYTTGASAIEIDNCQGIYIQRVGWNGYDAPLIWGNNAFGVMFFFCGGGGCNKGFSYNAVPSASNSMERIIFAFGTLSNNNYGVYVDASIGGTGSQGGSFMLAFNGIDYNVLRHIYYVGTNKANNDSVCSNSMHVTLNHMETTGACSGSTPRVYAKGVYTQVQNECMENDTTVPIGYVELADYCTGVVKDTRFNNNFMSVFWSSSANFKRWSESGNCGQNIVTRIPAMVDSNGTTFQEISPAGQSNVIFADPNPLPAALYYGQRILLLDYFGGSGNFTLPLADFEVGYTFIGKCMGVGSVTVAAASGVTITLWPPSWNGVLAPGQDAIFRKSATNKWDVVGP